MKNVFFTIFALFLGIAMANAQQAIEFTEGELEFGNSKCPGVWVNIPEAEVVKVKKDWKKTIEKGTKSKAIETGDEITIFGSIIKDIISSPINIYSSVIQKDSVVMLFTSVEFSRDQFAVPDTREFENLQKALKQFAKDQYTGIVKDQLSAEEKKLKAMEKEIATYRKDKEKLEKGIESANTTISQETYKMATSQTKLSENGTSLNEKSNSLGSADGDEKKTLTKEVKSLESQKKSLEKDISSSETKIDKAKILIEENTAAIPVNQAKQDELGIQINEQKMVVAKFSQKLSNIEAY